MNRRGFLGLIGGMSAGLALDPEKLLWVPGAKKIFVMPPAQRVMVQTYGRVTTTTDGPWPGYFYPTHLFISGKAEEPIQVGQFVMWTPRGGLVPADPTTCNKKNFAGWAHKIL